ncbi:unnamed protein product [Prorocentrum cordatum]|uniref:Uncharacterized protein n=1 Tax=Prorocentrum cordatum TaxID=2364126 RepID=A0ABN9XT38_9DINO|nr:unnamed protein product [Polarella glacialis]
MRSGLPTPPARAMSQAGGGDPQPRCAERCGRARGGPPPPHRSLMERCGALPPRGAMRRSRAQARRWRKHQCLISLGARLGTPPGLDARVDGEPHGDKVSELEVPHAVADKFYARQSAEAGWAGGKGGEPGCSGSERLDRCIGRHLSPPSPAPDGQMNLYDTRRGPSAGKLLGMTFDVRTIALRTVDSDDELATTTLYEEICTELKSRSEDGMMGTQERATLEHRDSTVDSTIAKSDASSEPVIANEVKPAPVAQTTPPPPTSSLAPIAPAETTARDALTSEVSDEWGHPRVPKVFANILIASIRELQEWEIEYDEHIPPATLVREALEGTEESLHGDSFLRSRHYSAIMKEYCAQLTQLVSAQARPAV